jgi:hypothetical protein
MDINIKRLLKKIRLEFIIKNRIKAFLSLCLDKIIKNLMKFKSIKYDFHQDKQEEIQSLIERNQSLEQKVSKNYFLRK